MNVARTLSVQAQVIHALILRETRTRFGQHQLGFLWAFLEPMLFVGMFVVLYTLADKQPSSGMPLMGFLTTGIVTYLAFREAAARTETAVQGNRGLLFYPQVRPLDLVVSRLLLEFSTYVLVMMLLMGGEALATGQVHMENPLAIIYGLAVANALGGAFGLLMSSVALYFPTLQKLTGAVLTRPLFWMSGLFFTANDLPLPVLQYFRFNPILHCTELVRDGFFFSYSSRIADPTYPILFALTLGLFALLFERASRAKIQLS